MPNALKLDLHNKVIVFDDDYIEGDPAEHPFYVYGGFGANGGGPGLKHRGNRGAGLFGVFLSDPAGRFSRMEGWMVAAELAEVQLSGDHISALADARLKHPASKRG